MMDVDKLANFIRKVDGNNTMGAGALADEIVMFLAEQGHMTSVPAGWKIVPVEPTQSMNSAGYMRNLELGSAKRSADETYKAMLAAAPQPPAAPAHAHPERSEGELTDAECHETLMAMTKHMETWADENDVDELEEKDAPKFSGECIRFIAAHLARKG